MSCQKTPNTPPTNPSSGSGGTTTTSTSTNNKVCTVCFIESNGVQLPNSLAASYAGSEADVTSWENEFKSNNSGIPNITPVCIRKTNYDQIVCTECYTETNGQQTSLQTFTSYESEVTQWEQTLTANNSAFANTVCKRKGYLKDNFCTECEVIHSSGSTLNAQYVGTQTELSAWELDYKTRNEVVSGVTVQCYRK